MMKTLIGVYSETQALNDKLQKELHEVFLELRKMNAEEKAETLAELQKK